MGHSRKDPHSPHRGNFCRPEGRGEKIVSDNSKCIRTSKGGRGVNFQFPLWGGMDVFWNDPIVLLNKPKRTKTQKITCVNLKTARISLNKVRKIKLREFKAERK
jgi:hypothetical protein